MSAPTPVISVVVCSRNGADRIGPCLEAVTRQTVDVPFEIIVVDDGSTDNTRAVAESHRARVVRHERSRGVAAARNSGVAAARGEIVAFTDDDCVPHEHWLARLLEAYDDDRVVCAGGGIEVAGREGLVLRYLQNKNPLAPLELDLLASDRPIYRLGRYVRRTFVPPRPAAGTRPRAVSSLATANVSFRRAVLDAVGGFDESLLASEDEDICRRVRGRHPEAPLLFIPEALVTHVFTVDLRDTLRRSALYGRGSARLFGKYGGTPTVFPSPALLVGAATASAAGLVSPLLVALAPLALYPSWPRAAVRDREAQLALGSYVQVLEELCATLGFLHEHAGARRRRPTGCPASPRSSHRSHR